MAKTFILDPQGMLRTQDVETNKILKSTGEEDLDQSDFLEVIGNDTEVASGQRKMTLHADNDDADVTRMHLAVTGKGNGLLILPKMTTAQQPTAAAALNGGMYYDTTTNDVMVCANGAWAVVGAQT